MKQLTDQAIIKIINAMFEYECFEDCAGQSAWEKLVTKINKEIL